jgi:Initiator Replication protein
LGSINFGFNSEVENSFNFTLKSELTNIQPPPMSDTPPFSEAESNLIAAIQAEGLPKTQLSGGSTKALRKAVDTLAIVPTKHKISILARKVYNVMMHYAQEQGLEPPIYRVRLRDVINAIDFNSNNTEILKEHLRQMVTTTVEWQSPTKGEGARWGVSALIAHAELINEGNEVFMEWSYAPNIKQSILDPQRFARISLTFQAALKSIAALVLYEICSRYVDNPGGVTARQHWTWWRPVLTGVPEGHGGTYIEWKYFKRDVIKGAIAEVNSITDLQIESIEHRKGRAVVDLQFRVSRKAHRKHLLTAVPSPVDLRNIGRAINSGVPQEKAERLMAKFGEKVFSDGLDALDVRLRRSDLGDVRAPDKFLATMLTNLHDQPKAVIPVEVKKREDKAVRVALIERYRDHKRKEAANLFHESPEAQQQDQLVEFEIHTLAGANPALQRAFRSKGLRSPMTRAIFLKFLADSQYGRGWDTPSDSELLEFSLKA